MINLTNPKLQHAVFKCEKCGMIPEINYQRMDKIDIKCQCGKKNSLSLVDFLQSCLTPDEKKTCYEGHEDASTYCLNCQKWFCDECAQTHRESQPTHSLTNKEISFPKNCESSGCQGEISAYCTQCEIYYCEGYKNSHDGRKTVQLNSSMRDVEFKKFKRDFDQLNSIVEAFAQTKQDIVNELKKKIKALDQDFETFIQNYKHTMYFLTILSNSYNLNQNIKNYSIFNNISKLSIINEQFKIDTSTDKIEQLSEHCKKELIFTKLIDEVSSTPVTDLSVSMPILAQGKAEVKDGFSVYTYPTGEKYEGKL